MKDYENTLRLIISQKLGSEDDVKFGVSSDRIEKWKEKREIEIKKHKGFNIESRIIYYSDLYDLRTIILKNWEIFKEILLDKKKFEVFFDQMETFRNTIYHGRNLLTYQEELASGITGDLKTQLVNFHSKNTAPDDYFVKIIRVNDSLGNSWNCESSSYGMITQSVIRVGDYLELNIEAFDPQNREIQYALYNSNFSTSNCTGKFQIDIEEKMIGNIYELTLSAEIKDSEFKNKDFIVAQYTILPKAN